MYENPRRTKEALARLRTVHQGTDSLSNYIARFQRILYEAGGKSWDDDRKINAFRPGLSQTILQRLDNQPDEPTNFKEFVRFVQRFSGSSFRQSTSTPAVLPAQRPSHFQHSRTQSYQRPQQATEPMDLNVIETDEQAEG
ncbi:hypothetical protein ACMFMG_011031 [Clarireedia jacksonii]